MTVYVQMKGMKELNQINVPKATPSSQAAHVRTACSSCSETAAPPLLLPRMHEHAALVASGHPHVLIQVEPVDVAACVSVDPQRNPEVGQHMGRRRAGTVSPQRCGRHRGHQAWPGLSNSRSLLPIFPPLWRVTSSSNSPCSHAFTTSNLKHLPIPHPSKPPPSSFWRFLDSGAGRNC